MNVPEPNASLWRQRYENLRRHFLEGRQILGTDPLGLVLLLRIGVAGWMRQWTAMPTGTQTPASVVESFEPSSAMSTGWQHELTLVLAQMAARHLPTAQL
jgi:hypothetical protein